MSKLLQNLIDDWRSDQYKKSSKDFLEISHIASKIICILENRDFEYTTYGICFLIDSFNKSYLNEVTELISKELEIDKDKVTIDLIKDCDLCSVEINLTI